MKQQMASSAYYLKPAEVRKLFIAAPNFRDRCILKSLYWLGLRRQELIDLDIRDIDFDRKRVQVRAGKGDKTRIIPIIDEEFPTAVDAGRGHYSSPTRTSLSLLASSTTSWSR